MQSLTEHERPEAPDLLKWWRKRRGLSQMALAHEAGISPRHMSFVETGRSRPGREVLLRPGGFRERLLNWPDVAHLLLERLRRQVAENPTREGLRALLERLESWDLPPEPGTRTPALPILPLHFDLDGRELRLVSLTTTFGAPQDVTVQELRLEAFLPADEESDRLIRAVVGAAEDDSQDGMGGSNASAEQR